MDEMPRSFSEFKPKHWKNFTIVLVLIGVILLVLGIKELNFDQMILGSAFVLGGVILGVILHVIFGIKIIELQPIKRK